MPVPTRRLSGQRPSKLAPRPGQDQDGVVIIDPAFMDRFLHVVDKGFFGLFDHRSNVDPFSGPSFSEIPLGMFFEIPFPMFPKMISQLLS